MYIIFKPQRSTPIIPRAIAMVPAVFPHPVLFRAAASPTHHLQEVLPYLAQGTPLVFQHWVDRVWWKIDYSKP